MNLSPVDIFNWIFALVLSLGVHEYAHARAALVQGDTTAKDQGRLTLNPIAHIDLVGTVVLPLVLLFSSGMMFGWAKPVPVDPRRLRNQRYGYMMVAAAGPAANLVLCFLAALVPPLWFSLSGDVPRGDHMLLELCRPLMLINALLAVFNMLPVHPLDGGAVFAALLPDVLREKYERFVAPYGMFILLALMLGGGLHWVSGVAFGTIHVVQLVVGLLVS